MMESDSEDEFTVISTDSVPLLRLMEESASARQNEINETKNLTIVLLGKTGEGKSSTGNTLLGEKRFKVGFGQKSATQIASCEEISIDDFSVNEIPSKIHLKIIDTPGLFDQPEPTEKMKSVKEKLENAKSCNDEVEIRNFTAQLVEAQQEAEKDRDVYLENEIQKCISLCGSGVDAFFLVMNCQSRFDRDCRKTLEVIKKKFGAEHLGHYLFVVFTHSDSLERKEIGLNEFLEVYLHDDVKELLEEISRRHVFVDNTLLESTKDENGLQKLNEEREKIIQAVLKNINQRNSLRYTSKHFCIPEMKMIKESVEKSFDEFEKSFQEILDAIDACKDEYVKTGNLSSEIEGGASASSLIVGSILQIAGIALAAPTGGLSLGLTAAGVGVSVVGGSVNIGSTVVNGKVKSKMVNEINDKIGNFVSSTTTYLNELVDAHCSVLKLKLEYWPAAMAEKIINDYETRDKEFAYGQLGANVPKVICSALQTSFMTAVKVSDDFAKVVGLGARAVPIVGLVVGAVADLFSFGLAVNSRFKNRDKAEILFQEMKEKCDLSIGHVRKRKQLIFDEIDDFCKDPVAACSCVICDELWEDPVICPESSKHIGCRVCIQKWLNLSPTCPTCRCQWSLDGLPTSAG